MLKSLLWDIDYQCNLQCIHCYNIRNNQDKRKKLLYNYEMDLIIDKIANLDINHIHLLGGEPLLYTNIIELVRKAKQREISISINTNGLLLSEHMIKELLNVKLDQITVSLDGENAKDNDAIRGENTFKTVTKNIENMASMASGAKSDLLIQIAVVITKKNIENIYRMPKLADQLGVHYLDIMPIHYQGNGQKNKADLEISEEEYKAIIPKLLFYAYTYKVFTQIDCDSVYLSDICQKMGFSIKINPQFDVCQGGKKFLYMNAEGNLYPCGPMSFSDKWNGGNINLMDSNVETKLNKFSFFMKEIAAGNGAKMSLCQKCPLKTL